MEKYIGTCELELVLKLRNHTKVGRYKDTTNFYKAFLTFVFIALAEMYFLRFLEIISYVSLFLV